MVSQKDLKIAVLTGTTASGKTGLGIEFARAHGNIEIINADSLLVYRGMDIGTAKPTTQELKIVPHHLIDICDPSENFTAGDFVKKAHEAIEDIQKRGKTPLVLGGTGFYLKALILGLWDAPKTDRAVRAHIESRTVEENFQILTEKDPTTALRIGINDHYRIVRALEIIEISGKTPTELESSQKTEAPYDYEVWILDRPEEELRKRIHARSAQMIEAGLIEEVKVIREKYPESRALGSVGYRQVCSYLDGVEPEGRKIPSGIPGLLAEIELGTRQLVKKQRTWFRGQIDATWFEMERDLELIQLRFKELYLR